MSCKAEADVRSVRPCAPLRSFNLQLCVEKFKNTERTEKKFHAVAVNTTLSALFE